MIERIDKETGEVVQYTEDEFVVKQWFLLDLWNNAKAALASAKETEMELRKQFVEFASDPEKKEGTENLDLGDEVVAKIEKKLTYGFIHNEAGRLDKKAIDAALSTIEELVPENGEELVDNLVKWSPSLSVAEYRKLDSELKQIMDKVIVTKEAAPTLSIKDKPKAKASRTKK